jgi:hypothetical protein
LLPADTRGVESVSHLPQASQPVSQLFSLPHELISRPANPSTTHAPKKLETSIICVELNGPHGGDCERLCLLGYARVWSVESHDDILEENVASIFSLLK